MGEKRRIPWQERFGSVNSLEGRRARGITAEDDTEATRLKELTGVVGVDSEAAERIQRIREFREQLLHKIADIRDQRRREWLSMLYHLAKELGDIDLARKRLLKEKLSPKTAKMLLAWEAEEPKTFAELTGIDSPRDLPEFLNARERLRKK